MDIEKIKQVGINAAYCAGEILRKQFGNLKEVRKKGAIDLVTEADIASENAIVHAIRQVYPDHAILAEESGSLTGKPECRWIIDPLDGTTNFAHRLGIFSVSIAFSYQNETTVGIVFNPVSSELFTAMKGHGAYLNDRLLKVSSTSTLRDSLLVTGFPYNLDQMLPSLISRFQKLLNDSQGIRRLGSAALDLCYVAGGVFDGFWEENLKPWDTAAGAIIAKEAGASVTNFKNQPYQMNNNQILATNGHIHSEMMILLESKDAV